MSSLMCLIWRSRWQVISACQAHRDFQPLPADHTRECAWGLSIKPFGLNKYCFLFSGFLLQLYSNALLNERPNIRDPFQKSILFTSTFKTEKRTYSTFELPQLNLKRINDLNRRAIMKGISIGKSQGRFTSFCCYGLYIGSNNLRNKGWHLKNR